MTPGITNISKDVYDLHMTIFFVCVGIAVVVFSIMLYTIIFHRKSVGAKPAKFHDNLVLEIVWTIIPFGILLLMAKPAIDVLYKMEDKVHDADLIVKITGYQWYWGYEYREYQGKTMSYSFDSRLPLEMWDQVNGLAEKQDNYILDVDNPIVLPVNKKVRFLITANDVIHSWWVPALGYKKDAIPGFINEAWTQINEEGTYYGKCAELCGFHHGYMPIKLVVKSEKDFEAWLKKHS